MSTLCSCFRSNPQVQDGGQRPKNRQSIRKDNHEMDLLEINKRGMEDEEEWIGDDNDGEIRASHQTDNMDHRGDGNKYESSCEKAIDDFMSESQQNSTQALQRAQTATHQSNRYNGNNNQVNLLNGNSSFKKTGVCISKCYQMLCGKCGRRFAKIMILELTADTDHITAYEAQSYFNSSQNHDYECPFCFAKVIIVLSTSMIVGDAQQLDYQKTLDKASQQERMRLAQQMGIASTTAGTAGTGIPVAAGQAMSSLGLASGYLAGESLKAGSDQLSQEHAFLDDAIETRPQLLYTKFQRLKNTTKLAKVVIVDEVPFVRLARNANPNSVSQDGKDPQDKANKSQNYSDKDSQGENRNLAASQKQQSPFDKYQSSKALLYYPEEQHAPNESACTSWNSRVMKHLMKQKMQKNDTFYASKVLKGDNHFLRRQSTHNNVIQPQRQSASANQTPQTKSRQAGPSGAKKGLMKSQKDKDGDIRLEMTGGSRQATTNLDQSRIVNNHESTHIMDTSVGAIPRKA